MIKVTYKDHMGSDLSVVNAARVSFGKESHFMDDQVQELDMGTWSGSIPVLSARDEKLVGYLAKHKHMSPFGHCFASFHVKAPIFVARQLVKHKFLRWNEISRRYVDDEPEFYSPKVWRGRSDDKKQGSSEEIVEITPFWDWQGGFACDGPWTGFYQLCEDYYDHLLSCGVAPEQARMVLPQSTMTEWWWSGSLDAFADMCYLRCKEDTQYESRLVANQISELMKKLFPVSWDALLGETNDCTKR
ncbi:FAD-dependent thymidylate synthase [Gammaproteobacteria bacterium]|nr:FAD-dependent thymidylate synthase [Gammaproteobacteria bacterium]